MKTNAIPSRHRTRLNQRAAPGLLSLGALLVCLIPSPASTADELDRPNIILLMGDDHGWEETGYNGHPHVKTPVLDDMAATGLRLDRFYSGHAVCSPTRGSVLTGRHPNRYGTFSAGFSLRPEEITIGHLLGEAGYLRGHFGKWHVGTVKAGSPTNPGAMGFDEWVSHDNFFELDPPLSRNGGPPEIHEGESSAVLVDETRRFIEKAKAEEKPFLAVVWFGSPHEPYSGLPDDLALYDDLPEKYADRDPVRLTSNETGRQVQRPLGDVLRERYAEITAMDRAIGTLRDFLESEDLRDDTLVWYCGDNGTSRDAVLASPLRGHKAQNYDGGIRVPGLVEWPARIPEPRVSDTNAVTSDILPTLCALARRPLPKRPLDGLSLVPLFDGYMSERPEPIFFWSYDVRGALQGDEEPWIDPELQEGTTPLVKLMGDIATRNFRNYRHPEIREADYRGPRAMLGNRHKLVVHDGKEDADPKVELFDLRDDPAEEKNLAESHPEIADSMKKELRDWQQSVLESLTGADYVK
ncbi:MAG: sulfatase-like hydrolase/transferase [Verrucomicrobiales bacterium]